MQTSPFYRWPESALLKRAPWLLAGALASLAVTMVVEPASGGAAHAQSTQMRSQAPRHAQPVQAQVPADVPRGDLRNDIARNARTRPDMPMHAPAVAPRGDRDSR